MADPLQSLYSPPGSWLMSDPAPVCRATDGLFTPAISSAGPYGPLEAFGPHRAVQGPPAPAEAEAMSGRHWVQWADANCAGSKSLDDLSDPFKTSVNAFLDAIREGAEESNAEVSITPTATLRPAKRAYLFHWSWLIATERVKAFQATKMDGVPINWDHHDDKLSVAKALEMCKGFGLARPPKSKFAPALKSNHTRGLAIDVVITWQGALKVKDKQGKSSALGLPADGAHNTTLHRIGGTYGVIKLLNDAPHWSWDGK